MLPVSLFPSMNSSTRRQLLHRSAVAAGVGAIRIAPFTCLDARDSLSRPEVDVIVIATAVIPEKFRVETRTSQP